MDLQTCIDFCNKNKQRFIGKQIKDGGVITGLIPAPTDNKAFGKFLEVAFKTDSYFQAQAVSKATYFEPLFLLEAPNPYLLYQWYYLEFPTERNNNK